MTPLFCAALSAQTPNWVNESGYRHAPLTVPSEGSAGFTRLDGNQTGVDFANRLEDVPAAKNQIRLSGSGVALGDVDGDGRCDIYFCSQQGGNRLYLNQGGWRFEESDGGGAIDCLGQYSTGALLADVEGDGDLDLLVNAIGRGTRLFLNDGSGTFAESLHSGLAREYGSMSMAMADMDGDGDLDLYIANYKNQTIRSTGLEMLLVNGRRMLKPEDRDNFYITEAGLLREQGDADILYINQGGGVFKPVEWNAGVFLDESGTPLESAPRDWSYSIAWRDMDLDGDPDLFTCSDFWSPDRLWINQGGGRFRAAASDILPSISSFSMGVDFADINGDGFDDFFVLDMLSPNHQRRIQQSSVLGQEPWPTPASRERPQVERNVLFLNRGDGSYAEIAQLSGLEATEWSWCPVFMDVDLDGLPDLLVTNGYTFDTQDSDSEERISAGGPYKGEQIALKLLMRPSLEVNNLAFRNRGDLIFEDASEEWGFNAFGVSQGMALADLDGDGDQDLVVNNMNRPAGIYRNNIAKPRVRVRLRGSAPNTHGIGARVKLRGEDGTQESHELTLGRRYLSSDESSITFAAMKGGMNLEVIWRNGSRSFLSNVQPDRVYEIDESNSAGAAGRRPASEPKPLFVNVSDKIDYIHQDQPYDDFARQPGLSYRQSAMGPGAAWFDLNGDGLEDLSFGGGRGSRPGVYLQQANGEFVRWRQSPFNRPMARDQTGLAWMRSLDQVALLAGSSNYEDGMSVGAAVRRFDLTQRRIDDSLPGSSSATGPIALADFDGDGDLDLFAGGRCLPGQYPLAASSLMFLNVDGRFEKDESASALFEEIGLVQSAMWSDLFDDGFPELVLAMEWGPVRVFDNRNGRLREITSTLGLDRYRGWWKGLVSGDFNRDGRLDFAAANLGSNSPYQRHLGRPIRLYHADLDGNGTVEMMEAYYSLPDSKWMPFRGLNAMSEIIPALRSRFATHQAYSEASIEEIAGDAKAPLKFLEANWEKSAVFLNRGDSFEITALPIEAQFSAGFGIAAADFDGDGNEDLFIGQNLLTTHPLISPYSSGRGLVLMGDGRGTFQSLNSEESGIFLSGQQGGCTVGDYNRDGRPDLAVAVHSRAAQLYRNESSHSGIRVGLKGPAGNPHGVGSVVRIEYDDGVRVAREVQAGSGFWSQNSPVITIGKPHSIQRITVRWPGGERTETLPQRDEEAIEIGHP